MAFEIRREEDVYEAIVLVESARLDEEIRFVGWPRLELTLCGEDFDGGVPTRVMPALLEFQRALDRAYARTLNKSVRGLSQEERRQVELIVRLEPGSTKFFSELAPALNNALAAAVENMSGTQTLVAILFVAAVSGSVLAWRMYLGHRADRLKHDMGREELKLRAQLTEEQNRHAETILRIAHENSLAGANLDDMLGARDGLLRRMDEGDRLLVDDEPIVEGNIARTLARRPREVPVQDRLDGEFDILTVDSGNIKDGFRVRVRARDTGAELPVNIPAGTLPLEQIADLQSGEWGKAPLHMRINVERVGKRIIRATLISAGLSRADSEPES